MIQIKVTADVLGARRTITRIDGALKNFNEPLQQIREYMRKKIERNFRDQGSSFKEPWRPLRKATVEFKAWRAQAGQISGINIDKPLIATGEMKNSFIYNIRRNSLIISNTAPYFLKHQSADGRSRVITTWQGQRVTLPRRVMMKFENTERKHSLNIINRWLNTKVRGSTGRGTGRSRSSGFQSPEQAFGLGQAR